MTGLLDIPSKVDELERRLQALELVEETPADFIVANPPAATPVGGNWKKPVLVATAVALPAATASGAGATGTLEANAVGALTVDGVAMAAGNRVLVKTAGTGVTAARLGIYEVIQAGGAAEKWKLTRTADANTGPELENATVFAHSGTAGAAIPFTCTTVTTPIVVDTTALAWAEAGNVNLGGAQTLTGVKTVQKLKGLGGYAGTAGISEMHSILAFLFGTPPSGEGGGFFRFLASQEALAAGEYNDHEPTAAANITTIAAEAGVVKVTGWVLKTLPIAEWKGVPLFLTNSGIGELVLMNENAGSSEPHRFLLPTPEVILKQGQSALLYYSLESRWLMAART